MRVLMISWEYPPYINGGLGRHVAELVPALVQLGIEVDIVTPVFEPQQYSGDMPTAVNGQSTASKTLPQAIINKENGASVHRVQVPASSIDNVHGRAIEVNTLLQQHLMAYSDRLKWDLIHTHDWLTGPVSLAMKQALSIPLVTTIHATERGRARGNIVNDLQRAIHHTEAELVRGSDMVIACSQYMFNEIQSFFQTPASKLNIIPNGVNIAELTNNLNQDEIDAFKAKYAAPDEHIVFTVSRLVYEKGVHRLIEAAPAILKECDSARIIVAGKGPEAENLRAQAQHLGVADKVDFVGFISNEDRNRFLKIATCAIFPSLYEPFGIVALEAMALECPVIVSDVGGFSEVVTHEKTGITIYPDNAESVAWGVSYILTHPVWTRRNAIRARQTVEELFNWGRIARLTKAVYTQVLKET